MEGHAQKVRRKILRTAMETFEVLSDQGDDVDADESTEEPTEMVPPMPPDPGSKGQKRFAGSFGNLALKITETKSIHSLIVWIRSKNSSMLCNKMDPWARNAPKSEPDVKGCFSVNFLVCSVCQKPEVYQCLPIQASQYDISSEGEDRPSDNSNDGEWWPDEADLNAVTIGNMTINSKPGETDGKRESGAGESVVRRLAKCRFETVKRLSERTTIRVPGGEK